VAEAEAEMPTTGAAESRLAVAVAQVVIWLAQQPLHKLLFIADQLAQVAQQHRLVVARQALV
jgi:hypothetical protein